ncbi:MAG: sucrase ferredoxin [Halomonas sp.]|nr:sucrase ferredoxin [Halomonas sp.]
MSHTFCTDLSYEQGDPLAGTAAHAERNLLLSWPRSKWQRNLRHASDMPATLVQKLDAIAAEGRRINLIHRHGQDPERHEVFLMPERRRFTVPREALEGFLGAWQSQASLAPWEQESVKHDLLLCCTHGKKDKCCAKYGYRTYKCLAQTVEAHQLPFDVWESSHLGGCRLAASIILLSPVRKYGRITPEQVLSFLQAEAQGHRFLPGYRGDSQLTPAQQCAQLAALASLERETGQPRMTLLDDSGDDHQRHVLWAWKQAASHGRLQVSCRTTAIMRVDMCSALEEGPSESRVWQATDIKVR